MTANALMGAVKRGSVIVRLSHEQGFGAKTLNERLSALKAMFNWSVRARLIPYNPVDWVKPRDVKVAT